MDDTEESQNNNMVSNLPLLFANGYPTSLDKITEAQIQNFIPFMVQCSLGNINVPGKEEYSEPEWWPEHINFNIPVTKPKKFQGNWLQKLREVVRICYQFHKSLFLLKFCNELASYEHEWLRFINNYNSTTSLFDRRSNKLLVTFRNENMTYDQPQNNRKCLLQQKNRSQTENISQQQMVEPPLFDIYLCDNCDAELYSLEAFTEHEKTCTSDDDVIICNSPSPERELKNRPTTSSSLSTDEPMTDDLELRRDFLLNFNLQCRRTTKSSSQESNIKNLSQKQSINNGCLSNDKKINNEIDTGKKIITSDKEKITRRNRTVFAFSKFPTIPFSSPAGQLLIKTGKTPMTDEYLNERLDRLERFCNTPITVSSINANRPKYLNKRCQIQNAHCTFKKPQDYPIHMYTFPRRHFTSKYRTDCLMFLNALLIKRCRPISVRLRKISENEIKRNMSAAVASADLNIKLIRDQSHGSGWKITSQQQQQQLQKQIVLDTIDLCSSDEDDDNNSYSNIENNNIDIEEQIKNNSTSTPPPIKQSKLEIEKIFKKLNSEITLTPINRKSQLIEEQQEQQQQNSEQISNINKNNTNICSSSENSNSSNCDSLTGKQQNKYEGNFLISQTSANQPKPLQPSVFLFSNIANSSSPLSVYQQINDLNSNNNINNSLSYNNLMHHHQQQNQENLLENSLIKSQDEHWLPNSNMNNNNIMTNHSRNIATNNERNAKKAFQHYMSDVAAISSPNRIISIDLTL